MEIRGSTILITGGTGSFGNQVARTLLQYEPKEVRIYSRDEKKQWEMQSVFPYIVDDSPLRMRQLLADLGMAQRMLKCSDPHFQQFGEICRRLRLGAIEAIKPSAETTPVYLIHGKLAMPGGGACYVPERLAAYRVHAASATATFCLRSWREFPWAWAQLSETFGPDHPGVPLVRDSWLAATLPGAYRTYRSRRDGASPRGRPS